jgi:signal transduction histidine kinase
LNKALFQIKDQYSRYIAIKDRVIGFYQEGRREAGTVLHRQARDLFFTVLALCEKYKGIHKERILRAKSASQDQALQLRFIAATAVSICIMLGVLLALVLGYEILSPVRRLTAEAGRKGDSDAAVDEVKALSHSVRGLIQDVDQIQSELEKSRGSLLQAEKMAMVGKLAAGMAHSIRNPFTSMKMRLFSLNRSLKLTDTQRRRHGIGVEYCRSHYRRTPRMDRYRIKPGRGHYVYHLPAAQGTHR